MPSLLWFMFVGIIMSGMTWVAYEVGAGWWVAPYPADYVHQDGSRGDWWTCPACAQHRAA